MLLLTRSGKPIPLLRDWDSLHFTGDFIVVQGHGEFDGELKAVYTQRGLGGAYIKAGRQPEEALEIYQRATTAQQAVLV